MVREERSHAGRLGTESLVRLGECEERPNACSCSKVGRFIEECVVE